VPRGTFHGQCCTRHGSLHGRQGTTPVHCFRSTKVTSSPAIAYTFSHLLYWLPFSNCRNHCGSFSAGIAALGSHHGQAQLIFGIIVHHRSEHSLIGTRSRSFATILRRHGFRMESTQIGSRFFRSTSSSVSLLLSTSSSALEPPATLSKRIQPQQQTVQSFDANRQLAKCTISDGVT
jgi:hypothetical protein